jgi:acyl-CoA thioester hydrolase
MDNGKLIYTKPISIRWADLDANFHMRHSVYYDFGAQQRIEILEWLGLTMSVMKEQQFGPVLFREECLFRREIRLHDEVLISAKMTRLTEDASRWTIQHEFLSPAGKLMALLTVEGAWMDTKMRKLASPTPDIVQHALKAFPRSKDFSEK